MIDAWMDLVWHGGLWIRCMVDQHGQPDKSDYYERCSWTGNRSGNQRSKHTLGMNPKSCSTGYEGFGSTPKTKRKR